jgi:NAD(P)-dependent dehydrogenase (short-subunit alcohol dehydrogenase family)
MNIDLSGKTVLVTGASRGIGKVIARKFAEAKAAVIVHYHKNKERAEETLQSLEGGNHFVVQADVADPISVHEMMETIWDSGNKVDILINNAGVFEELPIADVTYQDWQSTWNKTISTNLLGPANVTFLAAKKMIENGGGKIINISSRGAFRGEPDAPCYGASKAGLNAMSQSLAKALGPHNIFVYVIAPGFVETDMARDLLQGESGQQIRSQSPIGRVAYPSEIAQTALFLASEGVDFLTGAIIDINGASYLRS